MTTATECQKLNVCPFFLKFSGHEEFKIKGFKNMYCQGPLMQTCARSTHKAIYGEAPPDDMAPSGVIFKLKSV